jgi:hypothetical protein
VQRGTLTGAELRRLPNPGIDADRDLFLVAGAEQLDLTDGMNFFTVPRTILAGGQSRH